MNHPRHPGKGSSSEDSSFTVQQAGLMAVMFLALALTLQAQPGWWTASGGPLNGNPANDYAVANVGQLKQFTQKAVQYMNTNGGAGSTLNSLVAGWSNYYATNVYSSTNPAPADYQAVNQGQLKYIGNLIWTNLVMEGYTNAVPSWLTGTNASDYAVMNVAQVESAFNFDLTANDSDTNNLPDWWELHYLGYLGSIATNQAPAGNGLTLQQDYQQGNDPNNYYSQGGTNMVPIISIMSGNNQSGISGQFLTNALVVKVQSPTSLLMTNAAVSFWVSTGLGQISSTNSGVSVGTWVQATTGTNGLAQVYFQEPLVANFTSMISVGAGTSQTNFMATTPVDTGPPAAPSNITATAGDTAGEIDLAWQNNADNATYIIIQQSTDNVTWTTTATISDPTTTSYVVTGLTVHQPYYFRIGAANSY